MSFIKILLSLLFISPLFFIQSFTQELSFKWSEESLFSLDDLLFHHIVGENDENIFVLSTSDTLKNGFALAKKKQLVAFNKNTLQQISTIPLKGFAENKIEYKGLKFHTCVIQDDVVMVFWSKNSDNSEDLYVETFNSSLNRVQSIRKIYINSHAYDIKRSPLAKYKSSIVVCFNEKRKHDIFIGGEIPVSDNYVRLEYTVLSKELILNPLKIIELPIQLNHAAYGTCSVYEYLENGDVLIRNSFTTEKGKGVTENAGNGVIQVGRTHFYNTISYLKVNSNKIATIELPYNTNSFIKAILVNDELRLYGLYLDNKKTTELRGLYSSKFNTDDLSISSEYIKFEQSILDSLVGENESRRILLQDVLVKDDNILFLLTPSFQVNYATVGSTVLGYSLDNEFKWIRKIETIINSRSNFVSLTQPNKVLVYFNIHQLDELKKMASFSNDKMIIGFSILDTDTGELIEKKEIQIDRVAYFTLSKLINDRLYCLYFKKRGISSLGVFFIE